MRYPIPGGLTSAIEKPHTTTPALGETMEYRKCCPLCKGVLARDEEYSVHSLWERLRTTLKEKWEDLLNPPTPVPPEQLHMQLDD